MEDDSAFKRNEILPHATTQMNIVDIMWIFHNKPVRKRKIYIQFIWRVNSVKWKSLSRVWYFATPWTIQSLKFSRPEFWSEYPFPSPGDHPNPGIEPRTPTLQRGKYIKTKVNWKAKVEWWLPEVGRMGIMGSYCLMGTEFQFGKMNSSKNGQW